MTIVILVKTGKTSSRVFHFLNVNTFFTTCVWIENWEIEKILNNNFLSSAVFFYYTVNIVLLLIEMWLFYVMLWIGGMKR